MEQLEKAAVGGQTPVDSADIDVFCQSIKGNNGFASSGICVCWNQMHDVSANDR